MDELMVGITGDASEFYALANDLSAVTAKMVPPMRAAVLKGGDMVAKQWQSNAAEHFHSHAKNYPKAPSARLALTATSIAVDIAPTEGNQAFLGRILEFGGEHSPAYLDGLRAVEAKTPAVEQGIGAALDGLLP